MIGKRDCSFDKRLAMDYLKAVGIVLVVIGHYPLSPFNVITPYMFHMPLFFFIGGVLFSGKKNTRDIIYSILKKYVAYIIYTYVAIGVIATVFKLLFNISIGAPFSDMGVQVILSFTNNFSQNPFFVVAWFLLAYALIMLCFHFIITGLSFLGGKFFISSFALAICVCIGWLGISVFPNEFKSGGGQVYNLLSQVSVGLMFYCIGFVLKEYIWSYVNVWVCLGLFSLLYVLEQYGLVSPYTMSQSDYPHGLISVLLSTMICIYLTLSFVVVLSCFVKDRAIAHIGRESKVIMSYHLLSFVVIDIVVSSFGLLDMSYVNVFNHYAEKWTWPIYISGGVAIPLLGLWIYENLKLKIRPAK